MLDLSWPIRQPLDVNAGTLSICAKNVKPSEEGFYWRLQL